MMTEKQVAYYDFLVREGIIDSQALDCILGVCGTTDKVLSDVLCWYTGYEDLEECMKDMGLEE